MSWRSHNELPIWFLLLALEHHLNAYTSASMLNHIPVRYQLTDEKTNAISSQPKLIDQ